MAELVFGIIISLAFGFVTFLILCFYSLFRSGVYSSLCPPVRVASCRDKPPAQLTKQLRTCNRLLHDFYGRTTIDRAFSITSLLFDLRTELLPQREHLVDIIPSDQKLTGASNPASAGTGHSVRFPARIKSYTYCGRFCLV
jgi:hypothetical protein